MEFKTPNKLDQYKKLLKMAEAGKLGAFDENEVCMYRYKGKRCAVGALFNNAQLDDIERLDLNSNSIGIVAVYIGCRNIETVTGFTLDELETIQDQHDRCSGRTGLNPFIEFVEREIEKLKGQTSCTNY